MLFIYVLFSVAISSGFVILFILIKEFIKLLKMKRDYKTCDED